MPRWPTKSAMERFCEKVVKGDDGCWKWVGSQHPNGYGMFSAGGNTVRAHRFIWESVNGPILNGLHVLHKCDNPSCVNPDHLFLGTHAENMADRHRKGRSAAFIGEAHPRARLTEDDVRLIRNDTRYPKIIAQEFGVSTEAIKAVKYRRNWKHVT